MILCCGEALIDMLPRESRGGEDAFAPKPGGAVFNTAIALARLGQDTGFFTGLSTDLFGRMLTERLDADGVDYAPAARSDRPTTLAFVTLKDGQARYAFYDENTAGRMIGASDLPSIDGADALFFGGISLVVEPCADAYEALARQAARGHLVMIDPNVRPSFIADEDAYRARIGRMIGLADVIKISDEDLRWLAGPGDVHDHARALLDKGPKVVCLTEGADGVRGYADGVSVRVAARKVEVVDTVGAGDTFNAGVLASLARDGLLSKQAVAGIGEDALRRALDLGARAAAVTVGRAGANPPTARELGLD